MSPGGVAISHVDITAGCKINVCPRFACTRPKLGLRTHKIESLGFCAFLYTQTLIKLMEQGPMYSIILCKLSRRKDMHMVESYSSQLISWLPRALFQEYLSLRTSKLTKWYRDTFSTCININMTSTEELFVLSVPTSSSDFGRL